MPTINKLISQWRKWINRNKTFTGCEMDELENHLLEEIDDLKQYEGLSEEEAFQKVVSVMGGREALDREFVKSKPLGPKACHWVKNHSLEIYTTLLLLIVFLLSDLIYSSTHFVDVYEPVSKNYEYKSSESNSYAMMTAFSEIKPEIKFSIKAIPNQEVTVKISPSKEKISPESLHTLFPRSYDFNHDGTITIVFPVTKTDPLYQFFGETIDWETKPPFKMITKPLLFCEPKIFIGNYYFVLDDKAQLWIEQSTKFTINSTKVDLKTQNLTKSHFILDKSILYDRGLGRETNTLPYIQNPQSPNDPKAIFFQPINPYQVLLFQKEPEDLRTIRLQLYQLPNQKYPTLVWDEVKLVRKPIHLWYFFFQKVGNNK